MRPNEKLGSPDISSLEVRALAAALSPVTLRFTSIGTTLAPSHAELPIQTPSCVIATAPMPMILPASRISGRTLLITTSATRVVFSSITLRNTVCPYSSSTM